MYNFFDRVNNTEAYRKLLNDTRDKNFIAAFGAQPNEKPFIAANSDVFSLYVTSDYVEAQRVLRTIQAIGSGNVVYLPAKEDVLLYKGSSSKNSVYSRNYALHQILTNADCAVTCIDALIQLLPSRDKFFADCFMLKTGVCYDTAMLVKKLVENGYNRVDGISSEGEFVMRGDILDVSMPFSKRFRVDFFDDEIESIREVGEDGKSGDAVTQFEIYPLYDTTGLPVSKLSQIERYVTMQKQRAKLPVNAHARLSEILSSLSVAAGGGKVDNGWLTPFVECSKLKEYLPADTVVFWDEPKSLSQRVNFLYKEHGERVANLTKAGEVLPIHFNAFVDRAEVFNLDVPQIFLQTLPYQSDFFRPEAIHNFKTGAVSSYAASEEALATDVKNWLRLGYETVIFAGSDGVEPTREKLSKFGVYGICADRLEPNAADALILPIGIEKGFVSHTNKLVVVGTRDLGRGLNQQSMRKSRKQAFLSVEKGDYVVHDVHGIGLCEGIQKITTPSGEAKDYIVVLYKNGDRLYVPVDATNMLSRYSGGENPTLSKLGGEDFAKVKSKVKSGIREMSINLLKLYAEREKSRGFRYRVDEYLDEEFEQYFPFKATEDQLRCQAEIVKDLTSERIMDRVLVGDVGYGKTEVAMRAAFNVVCNGYQVAVLAPTTILTEQHYKTFTERMSHFDIRVACLNRFRTAEQQRRILKAVASGDVDILIGTHRLLSQDVTFNRLGLLVLDEEQRFGVEHKEKLKSLKTNVDVLTMSATPIPRTLHMALSGIRDISTITTPPVERIAVETFVVEESDALLTDVITRELARGGQVYCVYNRVQSIDAFARKLSELVPNAKLTVAHGQMDETSLEDAVMSFAEGKSDVLVCTTIIENGIDIPNVNTLIVMDADKLGLSQLYQLRGRVGRSNRLAYAYFTYRHDKILSDVAYKRLSSITEYSELGSGFKIAMKDLEIRGAGNILGREQHGHMVKVGYDMYARLLQETVAELKGEQVKQKINTDVEIDIEAYAPDSYIPLQSDRMNFYRNLADCQTVEEVDKVREELIDVYGAAPKQVENLFSVAKLKLLASNAGVVKVVARPAHGELIFAGKDKLMRKEVFEALMNFGERATVSSDSYGIVFSSADFMQKSRLLDALKEFLQSIQT
ncbi:MAG: transcription-repair coupling factor [Clostridiales bacterium]|nr:transcription-repair coupling factor [Clostridiales bacterium]